MPGVPSLPQKREKAVPYLYDNFVNRFEQHILRIWNISSMTTHSISYFRSSKCPWSHTQARRRAVHQLRYQLHSVEGCTKCPTASKGSLGLQAKTRTPGDSNSDFTPMLFSFCVSVCKLMNYWLELVVTVWMCVMVNLRHDCSLAIYDLNLLSWGIFILFIRANALRWQLRI